MKKIVIVLVAVLLVWNIFLTVELFKNRNTTTDPNNGTPTVVNNTVSNSFTTDITTIVNENESKVVTVTAYSNENILHTGTGLVYSTENNLVYIVTNNHVIANSNGVTVTFDNGSELEAAIVGSDEYADLALLSCEPDFEVKPFKIGDSSIVKKGEYAITIGSPLGVDYQGTVSFGIISGIDRVINIDTNNDGVDDWDLLMIQTDAAINEGNSGGPLLNLAGEVIGITSVKLGNTEGLGFAIPSNEMVSIVDKLMSTGSITRPILGISGRSLADLTVYQKNYLGVTLDRTSGVLVTEVLNGSPAAMAGLQSNDIITKINDMTISDFKSFRKELYGYEPGATIVITFIRDGNESNVSVTLE